MANRTIKELREEYTLKLKQELQRFNSILTSLPEVRKIVLIGSYPHRKADLFTDLDLIIIMDSEKDFIQRTTDLIHILNPNVDLDLIVYTPVEFEAMKQKPFLRNALEKGKVLYERQS